MALDAISRWHMKMGKLDKARQLKDEADGLHQFLYDRFVIAPDERLQRLLGKAELRYDRRYWVYNSLLEQLY